MYCIMDLKGCLEKRKSFLFSQGIPSFEGVLSENQMKDYILAQKEI